jgi:hypothetical protein
MSTRAAYGFQDDFGTFWVYVHTDGYPAGAAEKFTIFMDSGLHFAFPRFEADEAAAGFVAANKTGHGGVRLTHGPEDHSDVEFVYLVSQDVRGVLQLLAFAKTWQLNIYGFKDFQKASPFFAGPLGDFIANAKEIEEKLWEIKRGTQDLDEALHLNA